MVENRQVRQADAQRVSQLVGGDDEWDMPRRQPRSTGDANLDAAIQASMMSA